MGKEVDVWHEKLCYDVMGAAIEVHRELGTGLLVNFNSERLMTQGQGYVRRVR